MLRRSLLAAVAYALSFVHPLGIVDAHDASTASVSTSQNATALPTRAVRDEVHTRWPRGKCLAASRATCLLFQHKRLRVSRAKAPSPRVLQCARQPCTAQHDAFWCFRPLGPRFCAP